MRQPSDWPGMLTEQFSFDDLLSQTDRPWARHTPGTPEILLTEAQVEAWLARHAARDA
jgi:hypothetical protein